MSYHRRIQIYIYGFVLYLIHVFTSSTQQASAHSVATFAGWMEIVLKHPFATIMATLIFFGGLFLTRLEAIFLQMSQILMIDGFFPARTVRWPVRRCECIAVYLNDNPSRYSSTNATR